MENDAVQHLEYFKIENFKGLDSLELKDIKQFNIILGDNNIGKTSVLEALLFDEQPYRLLNNLHEIFFAKGKLSTDAVGKVDYYKFFIKDTSLNLSYSFNYNNVPVKRVELRLIKRNDISNNELESFKKNTFIYENPFPEKILEFTINGSSEIYSLDFSMHKSADFSTYFPFIRTGLIYDEDLVDFYSKHIASNVKLKIEFIENLQILSNNIYDIIIDTTTVNDNPILLVLFKNGDNPIPLFMMGDGFIRLVRLILEIIMCKNARLMIDEIDNGMHFSRMREVWKVLLKVAKRNNTQLFITTHDAECLRAFKEVLENEEFSSFQEDVASYTLIRNKENKVESVKYNFQEFEHAIDYSLNMRG